MAWQQGHRIGTAMGCSCCAQKESTHVTENSLFFCDLNKMNVSLFSPLVGTYFQQQNICFRTINILLIRQTGFIRKDQAKKKSQRESRIYQHGSDTWAYRSVIFSPTGFRRTAKLSLLSSPLLLSSVETREVSP